MWKNGQCVTVKGKRYRVKDSWPKSPCDACAFSDLQDGWGCDKLCFTLSPKLGDHQYLEEICGNQGN